MSKTKSEPGQDRRHFMAATATGALGVAAVLANVRSNQGGADGPSKQSNSERFTLRSSRAVPAGTKQTLHLRYQPAREVRPGAKLWLFYDIRQEAQLAQLPQAGAANHLVATVAGRGTSGIQLETASRVRTFDLFPVAPEFLHLVQLTFKRTALRPGEPLDLYIRDWHGPTHPIDPFRFWLVADVDGRWDFAPIGYKTYRRFVLRGTQNRVPTDQLLARTKDVALHVTGDYPAIPADNHRKTPGVYWGELHGMAFNQRPLDDFYNYAKKVTKLDFCSPCLFSYFTCVGDTWQQIKDAARRHTEPGRFIPIVGFECGTPQDDSHRKAHFPNPERVPPIFCDSRPPAQEPFFQQRFHPDAVICKTLDQFYQTVQRYGGIVSGHIHTTSYRQEVLAEMWQKSTSARVTTEEQRVFALMRQGMRLGLVGGSDTHDSMPGNPHPEASLSRAAGFTGVWARQLTQPLLWQAILNRRVFATTGARIVMDLQSHSRPMGSVLPRNAPRQFKIELDGAQPLETVELLRDGHAIQTWNPGSRYFSTATSDRDFHPDKRAFYLVRVQQADKHKGWTSPIWFG